MRLGLLYSLLAPIHRIGECRRLLCHDPETVERFNILLAILAPYTTFVSVVHKASMPAGRIGSTRKPSRNANIADVDYGNAAYKLLRLNRRRSLVVHGRSSFYSWVADD